MMLQSQCAIEVWKASGERTRARLESLCEHFATVYSMQEFKAEIIQEAFDNVQRWMFSEN
jgi:hypothetical protein